MDDILWEMEKQKVTSLVAIDMTAAFDTVDHNTLLDVLEKRFGLRDTVLQGSGSGSGPSCFILDMQAP